MSKARQLADLLDSNGDVTTGALDNVPPSNDASALTTGTLGAARIGDGSIAAGKLTDTYLTGIADGSITDAKLNSSLDLTGKTVTLPSGVGGKVLQVATHHTTDRVRSYISSANVLPSSTAGALFTSFNFTPVASDSKLILQSSTFHVVQEANINDAVWCAAFYDTTSIGNCNPYPSYRVWSNAIDTTFVAFNHAFPSWGTSQKTIGIRFGVYYSGGSAPEWMCCNFPVSITYDELPDAYHDVAFSIMEVAA